MARICRAAAVAEDQSLYQAGLATLLQRDLGYSRVSTARCFDELVGILAYSEISLVLVSTSLPGFQGASSIRELRRGFPDLRIVAIGSAVGRDGILNLLAGGIHGFFSRELDPGDMVAALRFVETGHIFLPSSVASADGSAPSLAHPQTRDRAKRLTGRQAEILKLLSKGMSNKGIARLLSISPATVKVHVSAAYKTLGVHDRRSAADFLRA